MENNIYIKVNGEKNISFEKNGKIIEVLEGIKEFWNNSQNSLKFKNDYSYIKLNVTIRFNQFKAYSFRIDLDYDLSQFNFVKIMFLNVENTFKNIYSNKEALNCKIETKEYLKNILLPLLGFLNLVNDEMIQSDFIESNIDLTKFNEKNDFYEIILKSKDKNLKYYSLNPVKDINCNIKVFKKFNLSHENFKINKYEFYQNFMRKTILRFQEINN